MSVWSRYVIRLLFPGHSLLNPNYQHVLSMAGHFLWISLTAAVLSFLSASVLLDWSTAQFAEDIASAFTGLRNSLDATLSRIRSPGCKTFNHAQARSMLLKKSVALNASYQQVSFELRIGRLSGELYVA